MFERYTDQARTAVRFAQDEARRRRHSEVDAGHLLLGALVTTHGADDAYVDLSRMRQLIESSLSESAEHGPTEHIPFTSAAQATLNRGLQLALRARRNQVDDYDLLLAALDQPVVAETLTTGGVDLDACRVATTAARRKRDEPTNRAAPIADLPDGGDEVTVELLRHILRRLDVIVEHIDGGSRS